MQTTRTRHGSSGKHHFGSITYSPRSQSNKMAGSHDLSSFRYDADAKAYVLRTTKKELGGDDVLIQTTHSGVCYTDVHAKSTGCSLGHEGVGIIKQVGSQATNLKEGDRVGWGWMHSVCYLCRTPQLSERPKTDHSSHAVTARPATKATANTAPKPAASPFQTRTKAPLATGTS